MTALKAPIYRERSNRSNTATMTRGQRRTHRQANATRRTRRKAARIARRRNRS